MDDFRRIDTRQTFKAICQVAERGEPTIFSAIVKELRRLEPGKAKWGADLAAWVQLVAAERFISYHVEEVLAAAERRRLQDAAGKIAQQAMATNGSSAEALRVAQDIFSKVQRSFHSVPRLLSPEDMAQLAAERNSAIESGIEDPVLSFGLIDLDRKTGGGARPGQLIVVGARPGRGKSALMRDMTRSFAYQKRGAILFASNEMTPEQLNERDLSVLSGIPLELVRDGKWTEYDRPKLLHAENQICFTPIYTYFQARMTTAELRSRAMDLHSRIGICAVVVDYIQRMADPGKTPLERVGLTVRSLKSLALELNVPVVAGSQLNREVEKRDTPRPTLSDLRESGELEQEADIVFFIYRPDGVNEAEIIIAKQRQGVSGQTVKVAWVGSLATFRNLAR